ncbi:acyl carrier protein [Kitasatospora viridis]|uniref:Phosphopantetheine binding protein n=1 Tax=Kitasatospora viridis TaxID=281105 RepID=A0A561UJT8_9ACTN|nr:acyl carrier protein [Kitasatospora viridis]TWF99628.1 phosphopantetheine binding protein [Kitasatospora viridis]
MITKDDFVRIVRDELALPLNGADLEAELDSERVVSWDSLHMMRLVAAVERETGTRIPVGRLLEDRSLRGIYAKVAEA